MSNFISITKVEDVLNTLCESELQTIKNLMFPTNDLKQELISQILGYLFKNNYSYENALKYLIMKTPPSNLNTTQDLNLSNISSEECTMIDLTSHSHIGECNSDIEREDSFEKDPLTETKIVTKQDELETTTIQSPPPVKSKSRSRKCTLKDSSQSPLVASSPLSFPIKIGSTTTVHCLGTIVYDRMAFHDVKDLFPVGYKISRKMPSIVKSGQDAEYYEIVDAGEAPLFRITCSDDPTWCCESRTTSGAWKEALVKIRKNTTLHVSGPVLFGFRDLRVIEMLQVLPDVEKCIRYNPEMALATVRRTKKREYSEDPNERRAKKAKKRQIKLLPQSDNEAIVITDVATNREILGSFLNRLDRKILLEISQDMLENVVQHSSAEDLMSGIITKCQEVPFKGFFQQLPVRTLRKLASCVNFTGVGSLPKEQLIQRFLKQFNPATEQIESKSGDVTQQNTKAETDRHCSHTGPCEMLFGSCCIGAQDS